MASKLLHAATFFSDVERLHSGHRGRHGAYSLVRYGDRINMATWGEMVVARSKRLCELSAELFAVSAARVNVADVFVVEPVKSGAIGRRSRLRVAAWIEVGSGD